MAPKPPSAKATALFLERIAEGDTIAQAAAAAGQTPGVFYRRASKQSLVYDEVFAGLFAGAVQDRATLKADDVDQTVERRAKEADSPPQVLLAWAKRWNPAYRDKQQLEVTGENGGPIQVASKGISLAALLQWNQEHGVLADVGHDQPGDDLSAARKLLPEPGDSEPPAS